MATPKVLAKTVGKWKGKSQLHQEWLPEDSRIAECQSQMRVETDEAQTHALVTYLWEYQGERQEGRLLISSDSETGVVSGGWLDSWHMSCPMMVLSGQDGTDMSLLSLNGNYAVPGHPDWGWRIEFEIVEEQNLRLRMFNISPTEEESWAVEAVYTPNQNG